MPDYYESGGSEVEVVGTEQNLEELTGQELMSLMATVPTPERPSWMVTRFPVSMEEFQQLNEAAQTADREFLAAFTDESSADADVEAEYEEDIPEGEEFAAEPGAFAPPIGGSFQGIPQTAYRPPDCTCAVGPNDVMVAVNTDYAVYTKSGTLRRRLNLSVLFSNVLPSNAGLFDPVIAYDHYAKRWIVVVAARRGSPAGSWLMVGVSQGTDPLGRYWIWALDATRDGNTPTNNWADFPMLGFDTQGIYITTNQFQFNGGFQYTKLRILNKAELYAGGTGSNHSIKWYDFWNLKNPDNSQAFTVQPAKHFRGTGGNPPAYLINAIWPRDNSLTLWTLKNPIGYWRGGSASLTKDKVPCRSYDLPPDAEHRGTSVRIETNDSRLLSAVFQYVGNTKRIWTCHTSKITWAGEPVARSAVQWYEIDVDSKQVIQQNGYGASGKYYYFPAIQTDLRRNAYLVFGRSGSTEYASLRQTGRRVGAPLNDLENSRLIKAGAGSYTDDRWGDYFCACRDGGNANQVYLYSEYANTGNNWGTWIASVRF